MAICIQIIVESTKSEAEHDAIYCEGYYNSWLQRRCAGLSKPFLPVWKRKIYRPFLLPELLGWDCQSILENLAFIHYLYFCLYIYFICISASVVQASHWKGYLARLGIVSISAGRYTGILINCPSILINCSMKSTLIH